MATIPEAWIPAFIFGNVFAFFWLFVMLLTKSPSLSASWTRLVAARMSSKRKEHVSDSLTTRARGCGQGSAQYVREECPRDGPGDATRGLPVAEGTCFDTVRRHMSLSLSTVVAPVQLEWRDVGCSYRSAGKTHVVLQGVCGTAKPQQMMALTGPSGAGKSTLLDILSMRKNVGTVEGSILVNGQPRRDDFVHRSSYVPQEDNFVPTMTVLETLTFYSRLVSAKRLTTQEKRQRVWEVLNMVGLAEANNTTVGGWLYGGIHFRGLSGGERRRLSIATGVVSAPSVIFLDEPTSGLDSFDALNVIQCMRTLADTKGYTILASVHQPRVGIWNMFDQALILSNGRMMFSGTVRDAVPWFTQKLGYDFDPAVSGIASDWLMDLVSVGFNKPKEFYGQSLNSIADVDAAAEKFRQEYEKDVDGDDGWKTIQLENVEDDTLTAGQDNKADCVIQLAKNAPSRQSSIFYFSRGHYQTSWPSQFVTLYWRCLLNITRNPVDVAGRMLTFTYVGLFIGIIFYALADGAASIFTRLNVLFSSSAFYMFIPYISFSLFTSDRQFYSVDIQAKLCRPSAYYCSNALATLPFGVANATVFALVVYGLTGLRNDPDALWQNLVILVMESLIATQVLYFAATVTPNRDMAFMVASAFTALNLLLSNFLIPFEQITFGWVSWLKWLSVMGYTWNAITKIEFQDRDFACTDGTQAISPYVEGAIRAGLPNLNPRQAELFSDMVADSDPNCVVRTDQILQFFGIDRPFHATLMILVGYLLVLHLLTFAGLRFALFRDRK